LLAVSGEVDLGTAPMLKNAIAGVGGCSELWIDLSDVSFMDSTGLSELAAGRLANRDAQRAFVVICPPGPVRRVLELSGLDGYLEVFSDRSAANGHIRPMP